MLILDAHCDTITGLHDNGYDLYENSGQLDLKRLLGNGKSAQFFAVYTDPAYPAYALAHTIKLFDLFIQAVERYSAFIGIAHNTKDILQITEEGRVAAVLTMEGGDALSGDLSALRMFYRLGVRVLGLVWNYRNQLADGVLAGTEGGLTEFGRSVVTEANRLGVVIDVSHLNKQGFYDTLLLSKTPVMASHSNARSLCHHVRNLDDTQLLALKKNGGVVGVNFFPLFLTDSGQATMDDVVRHIEHIAGLIGVEHVGLGSDFDGINTTPKGLENIGCIPDLINLLYRLNYKSEEIEAIASGNFMRILRNVTG